MESESRSDAGVTLIEYFKDVTEDKWELEIESGNVDVVKMMTSESGTDK